MRPDNGSGPYTPQCGHITQRARLERAVVEVGLRGMGAATVAAVLPRRRGYHNLQQSICTCMHTPSSSLMTLVHTHPPTLHCQHCQQTVPLQLRPIQVPLPKTSCVAAAVHYDNLKAADGKGAVGCVAK